MVCTIYERRLLIIIPIKRRPKNKTTIYLPRQPTVHYQIPPPFPKDFFIGVHQSPIPFHPDEQQTLLLLDYDLVAIRYSEKKKREMKAHTQNAALQNEVREQKERGEENEKVKTKRKKQVKDKKPLCLPHSRGIRSTHNPLRYVTLLSNQPPPTQHKQGIILFPPHTHKLSPSLTPTTKTTSPPSPPPSQPPTRSAPQQPPTKPTT